MSARLVAYEDGWLLEAIVPRYRSWYFRRSVDARAFAARRGIRLEET